MLAVDRTVYPRAYLSRSGDTAVGSPEVGPAHGGARLGPRAEPPPTPSPGDHLRGHGSGELNMFWAEIASLVSRSCPQSRGTGSRRGVGLPRTLRDASPLPSIGARTCRWMGLLACPRLATQPPPGTPQAGGQALEAKLQRDIVAAGVCSLAHESLRVQ